MLMLPSESTCTSAPAPMTFGFIFKNNNGRATNGDIFLSLDEGTASPMDEQDATWQRDSTVNGRLAIKVTLEQHLRLGID
jgi:hypothetical protein